MCEFVVTVMQVDGEWVCESAAKSCSSDRRHSRWQRRLQLSSAQRCRQRRQRHLHSQPTSR